MFLLSPLMAINRGISLLFSSQKAVISSKVISSKVGREYPQGIIRRNLCKAKIDASITQTHLKPNGKKQYEFVEDRREETGVNRKNRRKSTQSDP
jgi:hypothetical protein